MLLWIARGIVIGAFVGCLFLTVTGSLLGSLMGGLASLPSMGNPEMVRKEAVRLASHGAVLGLVVGSVIGCIMGMFGKIRTFFIGASVGALSFGLGGAVFGSITVNNNPVALTRVISFSLIAAIIGSVAGLAIGLVIMPLDNYIVKKLQGTA